MLSLKVKLLLLFTLSILLFSSCFQWASRAFDTYPIKTAIEKNYSFNGKVIIIGAGASSLAAAKVLEQNGIDYLILEATDRHGGRLKKDTTLADFPIDLGAEWIHNQPQILNRLKGKKGDVIDEDLIPYHLNSAFEWDGEAYKKITQENLDAYFNFMPEYKFKKSTWFDYVNENFGKHVKHKTIYNSSVKEVNYEKEKVIITTNQNKV